MYIADSVSSLPVVLNIFKQFGRLSGNKLNVQKSELFPLNYAQARKLFTSLFPFRIVKGGFTYLGVLLTASLSETVCLSVFVR